MEIYINEKKREIKKNTTLFELKEEVKPNADIMIYNGFPVDKNKKLKENDSVVFIKKGKKPSEKEMENLLVSRHTPGIHEKLKNSVVGIAGAGGLGSNVAFSLTRMGIGKLIIADYDVVVPSNLNRQQYFIEQIGMYKTNALKENLNKINPYVDIEVHNKKVRKDNIEKLFSECSIIVEAFDSAESKQMLIDYVLNNMDKKIISGWGMAGFGPSNDIKTKKVGKLYICGDGESSAGPGIGLMAPRVGICANHQANQVVRIIIKGE